MNNNSETAPNEHEATDCQELEKQNQPSPDLVTESDAEEVQVPDYASLEEEKDRIVNQLLRLKADFDNYKRRNSALIQQIRTTANQNLVEDLLPIMDNFERALESAPADSPYTAGVKMIFTQLLDCLAKYGLETINALGQPFDPNLHEAVSTAGDAAQDFIVIAELQKGYLFKDKLLRASMVQVAPKKQQEEEESNG